MDRFEIGGGGGVARDLYDRGNLDDEHFKDVLAHSAPSLGDGLLPGQPLSMSHVAADNSVPRNLETLNGVKKGDEFMNHELGRVVVTADHQPGENTVAVRSLLDGVYPGLVKLGPSQMRRAAATLQKMPDGFEEPEDTTINGCASVEELKMFEHNLEPGPLREAFRKMAGRLINAVENGDPRLEEVRKFVGLSEEGK